MLKKSVIWMAVAALILLPGGLIIRRIFISEETRIRNMVEETASVLSKEAGENTPLGLGIRRMIQNHFDDSCSIIIPAISLSGTYSQDELANYAVRGRSFYHELDISIHDFGVEFTGKRRAEIRFTAVLDGTREGGGRLRQVHELKSGLVQREGQWLYTHVEEVEVLQR